MASAAATYDVFHRGSANRRVAETAMNRESSRSHSVFTVSLETRRKAAGGAWRRRAAQLHLVDLAGSERQKYSEATGARLKEASAINKSLSALGNVIKALVDQSSGKERHVPYRDSKLTFLLKDALGGRSRCTLLACVSPAEKCAEETLSTLKFAQRAKLVRNAVSANEENLGSVAELQEEVARLRAELAATAAAGGPQAAARVAQLEALLAASSRAACQAEQGAAEEVAKAKARVDSLEEHNARLERSLQSTKMVVRLREEALKRAQGSADPDADSSAAAAELAELRLQVDCHPEVIKARMEIEKLNAKLAKADGAKAAAAVAEAEARAARAEALRLAEAEALAVALEEKAVAVSEAQDVRVRNDLLTAQRTSAERAAEAARAAEERARAEMARAPDEEDAPGALCCFISRLWRCAFSQEAHEAHSSAHACVSSLYLYRPTG